MTDYLLIDYNKLGNQKRLESYGIGKKRKMQKKKKNKFEELIPKNKEMDYQTFLKTKYWLLVSKHVKNLFNNKCAKCSHNKHLQVHHKKYPKRFTEHLNIKLLECLCSKCHNLEHGILSVEMSSEIEELNSKFLYSVLS